MKFLDKIWDDTMGGPQPDKGLGKLRKYNSFNNASMASGGDSSMTSQIQSSGSEAMAIPNANGHKRLYLMRSPSISMDGTSPPSSPSAASSSSSPSSTPRERENVWRSVFHPGSNINTNHIGAQKFDKAEPKSPTVYDWLYSGETRSKYR